MVDYIMIWIVTIFTIISAFITGYLFGKDKQSEEKKENKQDFE